VIAGSPHNGSDGAAGTHGIAAGTAASPVGVVRGRARRWLDRGSGGRADPAIHLVHLVVFAVLVTVINVAAVAFEWRGSAVELRANDIASETIKAPQTVTFESELRTEQLRQEAYADARNVVQTFDQTVRSRQLADLQAFLDRTESVRDEGQKTVPAKADDLRAFRDDIPVAAAQTIVSLPTTSWEQVTREATRLVDEALTRQIRADEVAEIKEDLNSRVSTRMTASEQQAAVAIARSFIAPNVAIDEEATQRNREAAAAAVDPVVVTVQKGQAIVRDGDVVTASDVERLEHLGLLNPDVDVATRLGRSGLMAILSLSVVAYLSVAGRRLWQSRQLILVGLIVTGPVMAGRLVLPHDDIQYMFPIAAAAMLLAVLVDFQFAAVISALLGLMLGIVANMSFEIATMYVVGSIAGALLIWRAERTITFVWAGAAVALVSFLVAVCFRALQSTPTSSDIAALSLETAMAGVLSAAVTFLSFSLLGSIFGITTHLQLLELAHPNQPLLYRLAREAPGTYHHSIVVSNLAETGVQLVGGDPLFARVAVLYHDVGKIVRPTFFIENQANRDNPHDLLDPDTSARVIIDHVLDGVRLGRKARLPRPIIDIIEQHHGTTLIRYFYAKALEDGLEVTEGAFRYPGPRPQTKEAGVIMLADSVEAAVRSNAQSGKLVQGGNGTDTPGAITLDTIVRSVIDERIQDGQLDDCDLTMRDIDTIRHAFVQILAGIYHPRIEYPQLRSPEVAPVVAAT
jgi:putative nucleotidyltransferase with HDIG domain